MAGVEECVHDLLERLAGEEADGSCLTHAGHPVTPVGDISSEGE